MAEHTKEPWEAVDCGKRPEWDVVKPDAQAIDGHWFVATCHDCADGKDAEANARRIVECVNALAGMNPAAVASLIEAARELRTSLAITHGNILCEINRCDDPGESRWAGVPELLAKRIATFDEALTALRGAQ